MNSQGSDGGSQALLVSVATDALFRADFRRAPRDHGTADPGSVECRITL